MHLVNRDCWVDKEKQEPLGGQENTHLGGDKGPEAGENRWEKAIISCVQMQPFLIMPSL